MKQAILLEPAKLVIQDVPVPVISQDEVLVRVKRIGICGSDVHVYHGTHPYTSYPVVQGHELSCEVVKTGDHTQGFSSGDKITIEPQQSCGKCYSCESGLYNLCDKLKVIGFQAAGAASEYYAARADRIVKLESNMSHAEGAMVEPLAVAVRAISQVGDVVGKNVLVLGAGPIGNLVAQVARGMGAASLLISDVNPFRLRIAESCGIEGTVNPLKENLEASIINHFGAYKRADIIVDCAGVSASIRGAIACARKGTAIIVVAVFGSEPAIDMARINENELALLGTARYVMSDFVKAIGLIRDARVTLSPLITNVFEFSDYNLAYRYIQEQPETAMKIQINVS